jgi:hypothetical protein
MWTKRQLGGMALLSCVPAIVLSILTGMMKISHGDTWGRHNRSFLILFIIVFVLFFVPVTVKFKAEREASIKQLLRRETTRLLLGAALGYIACIVAYVGLIVFAWPSGASQPLGGLSGSLGTAAALLLNTYGWLFGALSFAMFDLALGVRRSTRRTSQG